MASILFLLLSGCLAGRGPTLGRAVVVTESDLPGFKRFLWGACELTRHPELESPQQRDTSQECFLSGYVTMTAVTGEGRAQIDEVARRNGYDPSGKPLPLLPISGTFVSSHSGIFEVYDRVLVFSTDQAAHDEYARDTQPSEGQYFNLREIAAHWGDESATITGVLGPDPAQFETQMKTIWRRGRVVNVLSTQGASDISLSAHSRLVDGVDRRVAQHLGD